MKMRILAVALGTIISTYYGVAARENGFTARRFVEFLYLGYGAKEPPDYEDNRVAEIFSPELARQIQADELNAHGEDGKLDYDPLCQCQDSEGLQLVSLRMRPGRGKITRAYVEIRLDMKSLKLQLDLVRTGAGWRVDDIHTKEVQSLLRYLRAQ